MYPVKRLAQAIKYHYSLWKALIGLDGMYSSTLIDVLKSIYPILLAFIGILIWFPVVGFMLATKRIVVVGKDYNGESAGA